MRLSISALAFGVACHADPSAESGLRNDSGLSQGPTAVDWRLPEPDAGWVSSDRDVGTGGMLADLDGDGFDELIVSNGNDVRMGPLVVYDNDSGKLNLAPSWTSRHRAFHGHLATGDVDGDGDVDVVVSRYLGDAGWGSVGGVDVYRNDSGQLTASPVWTWDGASSFSVALGDVDRDGDLDLAIAAGEPYEGHEAASQVLLNPGDGLFGPAAHWSSSSGFASDIAFADVDGDEWLDVVLVRVGQPHEVYLGSADGTVAASPFWRAAGDAFEGNSVDFGDVNGDGYVDLAISETMQSGGSGALRVFCGPSLDECWRAQDTAHWSAVSLEDIDGDGVSDLVAGRWWGPVQAWLANSTGVAPFGDAPEWETRRDDLVAEVLCWSDLDRSVDEWIVVEGEGLVTLPRRSQVVEVRGGVVGDGYLTGPGALSARVLLPAPRDLVVTDWTATASNIAFLRPAE